MPFSFSNYQNDGNEFHMNNTHGTELNHDISEMLINQNQSKNGVDDDYDEDDDVGEAAAEEEEDYEEDNIVHKTSRLTGPSMNMDSTSSFIDINFDPNVTAPMITPTTTSQYKRQMPKNMSKNKIIRKKWKISEDIALLNVIIDNSHLLTFLEYIKPMKIFWNQISKLLLQLNQVHRNSRQCHDRFKVLYFKAKKFKASLDDEFDSLDKTGGKKRLAKGENKRDLTDLQILLLDLLNVFRFNKGNIVLNPMNNSAFDPSDDNNVLTSLQMDTTPTINQDSFDLSKRNTNQYAPVLLTPIESTRSHSNFSGYPHSMIKNTVSNTTDLLSERNVQRLEEQEDIQSKMHQGVNGLTTTDLGFLSSTNNSSMNISSQLSKINHGQTNLKQEIMECENKVHHHDNKFSQYDHKINQFDKNFDMQASNVSKLEFQMEAKISKNGQQLDSHGQQLDSHGQQLDSHGQQLDSHGQQLDSHGQQLDSHGQQLDSHGQQLDSHGQQLDSHGQQLDSHGQQLDSHGQQIKKHDQDIKQQKQMLLDRSQRLSEQRNDLENQRLHNNNMYNNIFSLIDGLKNEVNTLKGEVKWLVNEVEAMKDKNQEQAQLLEKVHSLSSNSFQSQFNRHFASISVNRPGNNTHTNVSNESKSSSSSENGYPENTIC